MKALFPRGLHARLALAFSLLSVILTLALLGLVERRAIGQLEQQIGAGLADLAVQASDKLERGMFERYREIGLIADRPSLADPAYDNARLTRTLRRVQETYHYYEWIGVAGLDGKVKATGNGLLVGADVSKRPWFRQGLEGGFVGDVHEAVLLARLLPAQPEPRRFVDLAFPYVDTAGKVQGVLGAHVSWNWAREVAHSVVGANARSAPLDALILDAAGRVLLGPPELADRVLDLESVRRARTGADARRGQHLVERWPDGRDYVVGYQKGAGHANYPGLGWTVLVRQEVAQAYAPARDLRNYVLWSGAALAALFSLVGIWVARSITRPLARLADAATGLRQGGAARIATQPEDYAEIRALGRSLNALVSDLESRRGQLEGLNGRLEELVEARTRELRRALETVQASEARIRAIVETAQDAFIGVDLKGRIVDWNGQAELLLGWRREEAIGRDLASLVHLDQLREAASGALADFAGAVQAGHERRVERVVADRHGVEIPVEMSTGLTGSGEAAVFSIFLRDITERKRIERMKNEFVGTVSHELRTPLTSIRASLALLADGALGALPPDVLELVEICNSNCIRLNRLVDDMLDIQKIEAGMMRFAPSEQPLLPLAREAVRTMRGMAGAAGVTLELAAEDEGLRARFDHDRMTQVLVNLLSNAIRVAPAESRVAVTLAPHADGASLSVADSGPGIAPALRERVFQPFVQIGERGSAPAGGTGLGLAICKRIVEEHGGSIAIGDAPGGGALFTITLPA
ncbi:ATP-binding protein [Massilia suwonensis]|uniref:histidine kinase n=1 Tax=Massilia suwonensis TaxID=648895 RepID=A0ABW0MMK9_9BURK